MERHTYTHIYLDMNSESYKKALLELASAKMPFGKYKGYFISDIPEYYLVWYKRKGFPENKLGRQMQEVLELKENGLEPILRKIRTC